MGLTSAPFTRHLPEMAGLFETCLLGCIPRFRMPIVCGQDQFSKRSHTKRFTPLTIITDMKYLPRALAAVGLYAVIYILAFIVLARSPEFEAEEVLTSLLIFGVGLSVAAWLVTRGVVPPPEAVSDAKREFGVVLTYLVLFAILFLGWGLSWLKATVPPGALGEAIVVSAKLIVMVVLPAWLFTRLGHSWESLLGFGKFDAKLVRIFVVMATLLMGLQYEVGRGAQEVLKLAQPASFIAALAPLVWAWMTLDAGLTEEFLFRVLLQTRATALLRSDTAGIVVMALLFGLAHAPGYVLRGAHTAEGMAVAPNIVVAAAYGVAVVSPIGLMFGVLWARTRNLWLLALLHGWTDLLPNLAQVLRLWLGGPSEI